METMNRQKRKLSMRLIRKGALIEDTYAAFKCWDLDISFRENIRNIREHNPIGAGSEKWLHEVVTTLSSRFESNDDIEPLVIMARGGLPIDKWKACLLWHIGLTDDLYYRFGTEWLFNQHRDGAYLIRTEDVVPFVRRITDGNLASGGDLTEYGATRTARDLLRMASDFDILEGRVKRSFSTYHIPEEAFLYVLYGLTEMGNSTQKILTSKDWHLFLMDTAGVEREILRLHQYKALEYHIAGSIAHLKLPKASLKEYAGEFLS
jgi:hypothetical protein